MGYLRVRLASMEAGLLGTASMEAAAQDRLDVVRYLVDERGAATGAKAVVPGWSRKKKRIYSSNFQNFLIKNFTCKLKSSFSKLENNFARFEQDAEGTCHCRCCWSTTRSSATR